MQDTAHCHSHRRLRKSSDKLPVRSAVRIDDDWQIAPNGDAFPQMQRGAVSDFLILATIVLPAPICCLGSGLIDHNQ